ncbi:MAG TPA: alpha-2-macroglobulin family protein, partial [Candidatus Limnocylindrales bacterium]
MTGTFERHGRTQVFVPAALAPATTYTVTIGKGLARSGTDLRLLDDVVFRFETDGPADVRARLAFAREAIEAAPGQPLTVAVEAIRPWLGDGRAPAPASASLRIYRLPSLDVASRALTDFLQAPRWTQYSDPAMPTTGLRVAAAFRGPLVPLARDILGLEVPVELDPGWYILEIQGTRRSQAFLQVTSVSSWVTVMSDRTVVWVNDVVTHRALEGATVAVGTAKPFATSDADGLAVGRTPTALVPAAAGGASDSSPVLRVTSPAGAVVLVPFNVRGDREAYRGEWWETYGSANETYWSLLYTDRELYRQTDRIEAWGYLRGRDGGSVPGTVEVRLVSTRASDSAEVTAAASVSVHPGADGAFIASLPVVNLPVASYEVEAVVDGRVVDSRWIEVAVIRKPPYRLEVTANPLAVITGTPVSMTAGARFFDDTPVASLDLVVTGGEAVPEQRLTTDPTGQATATIDTKTTSVSSADWRWVNVRPAGPESADIQGAATVVIFPSAYDLAASGTVSAGRIRLSGKVTAVDLDRARRMLAAGTWDGDASGAPIAGVKVRATITELVPTRRQIGTEYDFVEKVVRPVYEYDYTRKVLKTVTAVSARDGTIRYSVPVLHADHSYEVELATTDRSGRAQHRTVWVGPSEPVTNSDGIQFVTDDGTPAAGSDYGIGDRVSWRIVDDGRDLPSGSTDRYLFVVAQRGLRAAAVTDAPQFRHTFAAADAPGIFVMGVRFTGTTYAPKAAAWADFDESQRAIRVAITADRERYRPGDTAGLSVRTTDAGGSPVAATVVVQAVDEKLFAMGGAHVPQPLPDLYARVDSGIVRLTATHQVPSMAGPEGEGGDTTGGGGDGDRTDFRDTLLFRELHTDASGQASTSVRLSDDLTSWHVSASAVTSGLATGVGELRVPVGLPFFVEVTAADGYVATDRPVIQVRAFGDALRAGDRVQFTVAAPALGLAETKLNGTAFKPVSVALPALTLGRPSITVGAVAVSRTGADGRPLADRLVRSFEVVASRLTKAATAYGRLQDGLPRAPDDAESATWTFADAGRGRLLAILSGLADAPGLRLDRAIAQTAARQILVDAFGHDPEDFPPTRIDLSDYPIGTPGDGGEGAEAGVGLLPYGGLDPWLAARVALLAPDALAASDLRNALESIRGASTTGRDLGIAALAGLAALGEPVLDDLRTASRQPGLTPTERIYLALGFEAIGDDPSAVVLERGLLESDGERLGAWV